MANTMTTTTQALPKLKRTPKPAINECGCGCGTMVRKRFVPGHDSKLHARVLRIERGVDISACCTAGELKAAMAAATHGPARPEAVEKTVAATRTEKPKTKKQLREEKRQAEIAGQLASIDSKYAAA